MLESFPHGSCATWPGLEVAHVGLTFECRHDRWGGKTCDTPMMLVMSAK